MIQQPVVLQPERFRSTVPYYVAGRPRYAPRLLNWLAAEARLTGTSRVLDLGCGPGFLAIPLARYAGTVIGIDPDPAMLEAAEAEAKTAGVGVDWRVGSSFDLTDDLAPLDLVVMGRSFHWMDRDATLQRLDALVAPDGIVATLNVATVQSQQNDWIDIFEALRSEFGRDDDHRRHRLSADWDRHSVVMLRSAFADVRGISVFEQRVSTIDDLMARVLSYSGSSPAALGDRRDLFEKTLRERLLAIRADGLFPEAIESEAIIARRPR